MNKYSDVPKFGEVKKILKNIIFGLIIIVFISGLIGFLILSNGHPIKGVNALIEGKTLPAIISEGPSSKTEGGGGIYSGYIDSVNNISLVLRYNRIKKKFNINSQYLPFVHKQSEGVIRGKNDNDENIVLPPNIQGKSKEEIQVIMQKWVKEKQSRGEKEYSKRLNILKPGMFVTISVISKNTIIKTNEVNDETQLFIEDILINDNVFK